MENLIFDDKKTLEFPYAEFKKYFDNYPAGIIKELIIDNAIACYSALLVYSLVDKNTKVSFENPKVKFVYNFKKIEINHLNLLNSVNKFKILKTSLSSKTLDTDFIKASLSLRITPFIKENICDSKVYIEFNLNLKKLKLPNSKSELLNFFHLLYKCFSVSFKEEKKQLNLAVKPKSRGLLRSEKICFPILNLPKDFVDMDILAIVFSFWMQNNSEDFLLFCVDDILELKGVKKMLIKNKRSGYKNSTRNRIKKNILELNKKIQFEGFWSDGDQKISSNFTWAGEVSLFEINSWVFENDFYFVARPSNFLKDLIKRKSYCFINSNVLKYHSYNNLLEKKAAYFLVDKLRKKENTEIKIKDFIELLYERDFFEKPSLIRDRLENVLDRLTDDKIIKFWHYKKIDEKIFDKKNWFQKWLNMKVFTTRN